MSNTIIPTIRQRFTMAVRAITTHSFPTDPRSFAGRLLGGIIPAGGQAMPRGTADYLRAYSHMPWLRAVAGRISYDVAATEWRLYVATDQQGRKIKNGMVQRSGAPQRDLLLRRMKQDGELQEIHNHPAIDMLANANSVQTGMAARRVTQIHLDLVGDGFWLLERDALGTPCAFWPIPPSWVLGTPAVASPYYRLSFRGWQGTVPVSEMVWFSDPDPLNPYGRGSGTAQALGDELETDEYASRHIKNFYLNRARPDLIVWPRGGDPLQEGQVERLEEQWTSQSGGFWRAFKPFFLAREVEVKELTQDFRSQDIVELRKYERDTIMQVFGTSPEVLGVVVGSNRATAAMSETIYQRRVLVPRLELMRAVMQERLMPLFDERIILSYVSPVVRDAELELQAAEKMPSAPTIDEWRNMAGLEPLADDRGKVHIGPMTWGPVAGLSEDAPLAPLPESDEDDELDDLLDGNGEEDEEDLDEKLGNTGALMHHAKVLRHGGDAAASRHMAHVADSLRSKDADTPAATRVADRHVAAYWKAQENEWHKVSATTGLTPLQAALKNPEGAEADRLAAAASQAMSTVLDAKGRPVFMAGAELAMQGLPMRQQRAPLTISLTDINPEAVRWAKEEAARLVSNVKADTRQVLRELMTMASEQGMTVEQVARAIKRDNLVGLLPRQAAALRKYRARLVRDGVDVATIAKRTERYAAAQLRLRAMTIARTELLTAVNAGQQALWEAAVKAGHLPATTERVWIVTLDDMLCEHICEPLTDATAPMNEPFKGGYMHPPAHPRCRCAVGIKQVPRKAEDAAPAKTRLTVERDGNGDIVALVREEGGEQ